MRRSPIYIASGLALAGAIMIAVSHSYGKQKELTAGQAAAKAVCDDKFLDCLAWCANSPTDELRCIHDCKLILQACYKKSDIPRTLADAPVTTRSPSPGKPGASPTPKRRLPDAAVSTEGAATGSATPNKRPIRHLPEEKTAVTSTTKTTPSPTPKRNATATPSERN